MKLESISIRMYEVGWGDCFLLRFAYARGLHRHVLIDFGTTASSLAEERERLMPVAADIRERCGGKLDAVVATHRHRDHIGGFTALKRSIAPGNVIAALKPELVLQPWTENPRRRDGTVKALASIERFLHFLPKALDGVGGEFSASERSQIVAMAQQNYPNRQAVESLSRLGRKRIYAKAGARTGLNALLPGFSARVLAPAPPGVSAWPALLDDRLSETWRRLSFAGPRWGIDDGLRSPLFPDAHHWHPAMAPPGMRWFISQMNRLRADEVMRLARAAHREINNSSLVLLIQGFGHSLLFPGDLELDGWASALHSEKLRNELRAVTVYKASHHGAGNGTPRSVWDLLGKGSPTFQTLVSRGRISTEDGLRFIGQIGARGEVADTAELRASGRPWVDIELEPLDGTAKLVA